MECKHSKLNTDETSLEQIWREDTIAYLWFNSNDQYKHNSINKTMEFLNRANKKAKAEGYIDVIVKSLKDEGVEYHSLPSQSIVVTGWRKETNQEWKKRIKDLLNFWERQLDNANRESSKICWLSDHMVEIEKALEKIK